MDELEYRVLDEIRRIGGDERLRNFIKREFELCNQRNAKGYVDSENPLREPDSCLPLVPASSIYVAVFFIVFGFVASLVLYLWGWGGALCLPLIISLIACAILNILINRCPGCE